MMLKISMHVTQNARPDESIVSNRPGQADNQSFLTFKVAGHTYAVSLLQIREVRTAVHMTRVAHAPSYVLGVTSVRGEIVPVIDLKERFKLPRDQVESSQQLVLISELESRKVGIQVDSVLDVVSIQQAAIQAVPRTTMAIDIRYLIGMTQFGEQVVLLIDLQKVLQPEELHAVAEATEEATLS
jgi:purine-binding chemotaxis protein CheW